MSWNAKSLVLGAVLICAGVALWIARERKQPTVSYSRFLELVESGKVAGVVIASNAGPEATCRLKDGGAVRTVIPADSRGAMAAMEAQHVDIEIRNTSSGWRQLVNVVPFLVLFGLWVFLLRRVRKGPKPGSTG